jgi:excisionase family DNA binding protein
MFTCKEFACNTIVETYLLKEVITRCIFESHKDEEAQVTSSFAFMAHRGARQMADTLVDVLTIGEAARQLRTSKSHISNILHSRVADVPPIPHMKIGRRVLILRSSLARWMEEVEKHKVPAQ